MVRAIQNEHGAIVNALALSAEAVIGKKVTCPLCMKHEFETWSHGWDTHAEHTCNGLSATSPAARKKQYKKATAHLFRAPHSSNNSPSDDRDATHNHDSPSDCDCDSDPTSLSVVRAQQIIQQSIVPIAQHESVATRSALARIAAVDIKSRAQVPNHTNSAMDGYALCAADLPTHGTNRLHLIGTALAGKPFHGELGRGQCVRIMTGAVLPDGADSVVIQERVERVGTTITVHSGEKAAANVRQAGEDLKIGEVVMPAGTRLQPSHLGLAASLGFAELPVVRRPRVAFFSNGDELRSLGNPLARGEVYDSNRYTLYGMLRKMGVQLVDLGIVPDQEEAIAAALQQAAKCADMVITSAGASVGEADYIARSVRRLGDLKFWKVAIKPGRPLAFGTLCERPFFALPGNPVSVMVTFQIFVQPALRLLAGETAAAPLCLYAKTLSVLKKRPGRTEYQRGILTTDPQQRNVAAVRASGEQGSGILRSMSEANCFIILPSESADVPAGKMVEVQPFSGLV